MMENEFLQLIRYISKAYIIRPNGNHSNDKSPHNCTIETCECHQFNHFLHILFIMLFIVFLLFPVYCIYHVSDSLNTWGVSPDLLYSSLHRLLKKHLKDNLVSTSLLLKHLTVLSFKWPR